MFLRSQLERAELEDIVPKDTHTFSACVRINDESMALVVVVVVDFFFLFSVRQNWNFMWLSLCMFAVRSRVCIECACIERRVYDFFLVVTLIHLLRKTPL